MNTSAPTLFEQQAAFQNWLMRSDPCLSRLLPKDRRADRMRIYADAYQLRLIDILANDFPVLHALVGEAIFETLAIGYLQAHPSRHPSARHFGRDFAAWLRHHEHPSPWLVLAEFEWMQGEVFDATDSPVLTMDDISALPADSWPDLRLELLPAMRILRAPASIPALVEAHNAGDALPSHDDDETAVAWLLWRRDLIVRWRRLDDDEALLLESARAGVSFSELCAQLAAQVPDAEQTETEQAMRAAGLLKLWIADGLVTTAITSPQTTL